MSYEATPYALCPVCPMKHWNVSALPSVFWFLMEPDRALMSAKVTLYRQRLKPCRYLSLSVSRTHRHTYTHTFSLPPSHALLKLLSIMHSRMIQELFQNKKVGSWFCIRHWSCFVLCATWGQGVFELYTGSVMPGLLQYVSMIHWNTRISGAEFRVDPTSTPVDVTQGYIGTLSCSQEPQRSRILPTPALRQRGNKSPIYQGYSHRIEL